MFSQEESDLAFRADLNGWFESECADKTAHSRLFIDKSPIAIENDVRPDSLIESFDLTLNHYNNTPTALDSLHRVIFQAAFNNKDYEVNFDVPRFAEGVDFRLFNHIIQYFNLYKYLYRELWKLNHEIAMEFIVRSSERLTQPVKYLHKIYIKLWHKQTQQYEAVEEGDWLVSQLHTDESTDAKHLFDVMYTFYECLKENAEVAKRQSELRSRMRNSSSALFHTAARIADMAKLPNQVEVVELATVYSAIYKLMVEELPINKNNVFSFMQFEAKLQQQRHIALPSTLCYDIRRVPDVDSKVVQTPCSNARDSIKVDPHEETFVIIASRLKDKSLTALGKRKGEKGPISDLDRLEDVIQKQTIADSHEDLEHFHRLQVCKLWCCYVLKYRASYWKSVLKLMIQFFDLWNSDIEKAKCADLFVSLIVEENMLTVLYDHILKHVQLHQLSNNQKPSMELVSLCKFFFLCLENSNLSIQLIRLRDHIHSTRIDSNSMYGRELSAFGSVVLWNFPFQERLTKACNKITLMEDSNESMSISDDIAKELLVLSVIWPYEVIRQLVLDGFQNRNQYKAIVPVLHNLGHLRNFGGTPSLILQAIEDELMGRNGSGLNVSLCKENIIQFIKHCCSIEFSNDAPLILVPSSVADQSISLLKLKDVLHFLILRALVNYTDNTAEYLSQGNAQLVDPALNEMVRVCLNLLNTFCGTSTKQIKDALDKSEPSAVLEVRLDEFIRSLSAFMSLRSRTLNDTTCSSLGLHIRDWELALVFIERLTLILQHALQHRSTLKPVLRDALKNLCKQHGWQLQVLWYPLIRSLIREPLSISHEFFAITGELDGLFTMTIDIKSENVSPMHVEEEMYGRKDALFEGWCDLFIACRSSTALTDELFKATTQYSTQWSYNLVTLCTHPFDNTIVQNGFRQVLHPTTSLAVPTEYANLLLHFLKRLYDSRDFQNIIKDHPANKQNAHIIPFLHQLTKEDTKNYFIVLTIVQLLSNHISSSNNDLHDTHGNYYVTNLTKMLQGLVHWGDIAKSSNQSLRSYSALKLLISKRRFNAEGSNKKSSNNEAESNICGKGPQNTFSSLPNFPLTTKPEQEVPLPPVPPGPQTVYFPPLDSEELISSRSLSILTLFHLCSLPAKADDILKEQSQEGDSEEETQLATIFRFIMLILDGLIDVQGRQQFQSLLQNQPKERYQAFKKSLKKTGFGVTMRMRPVFTTEEEQLLMPVIERCYHSKEILQLLQSVRIAETRQHGKKKEELYFH